MSRTTIKVGNALDMPGYPLSAAAATGDLLFTAGLIAVDPVTGLVSDGDITAQTHQVLDNLASVLAAAGAGLGDLLFVDVILRDVERDFAAYNAVYAQRMADPPPRRTFGAQLALPALLVEISAVAVRPGGTS